MANFLTGSELPQDVGPIRRLLGIPAVPSIYTSSANSTVDDIDKLIVLNSGSAINYTILQDSDMARPIPLWNSFVFLQLGAGLATVVAGSGATVNATAGAAGLAAAGQYAWFGVMKTGANTWVAIGNYA